LNKKPRFFCDNCGEEVDNDVRACPFCGRFFASVRCPKCGFSGEDKLFENGCPACGYSTTGGTPKKPRKKPKAKKQPPPEEPLPAGVYVLTIIALIIVVALLSFLVTR